jgi:hypothetical protein
LPDSNRVSRTTALILLIAIGGYFELLLLVARGYVDDRPTLNFLLVSSLVVPALVLAGVLWALVKRD